jgi:hypothetical protein
MSTVRPFDLFAKKYCYLFQYSLQALLLFAFSAKFRRPAYKFFKFEREKAACILSQAAINY